MAILHDNNLSFEFIFKEFDECLWLKYEIYFRWNDQYVFRDDVHCALTKAMGTLFYQFGNGDRCGGTGILGANGTRHQDRLLS